MSSLLSDAEKMGQSQGGAARLKTLPQLEVQPIRAVLLRAARPVVTTRRSIVVSP